MAQPPPHRYGAVAGSARRPVASPRSSFRSSSSASGTWSGSRWSPSRPSSRASSTSAGPAARWGRRWPTRSLFLFGGVGYLAPVALFAAGALIVLRPCCRGAPASSPARSACSRALCSASRPGRSGSAPATPPRDGFLDAEYLREHGGAVGEALYWVVEPRCSPTSAPTSCSSFLLLGRRAAAHRRLDRGRAARPPTRRHARTGERVRALDAGSAGASAASRPHRCRRRGRLREPDAEPEAVEPPEPEDSEPVVRATHVEAPALDAAERYPGPVRRGRARAPEDDDAVRTSPRPEPPRRRAGAAGRLAEPRTSSTPRRR